MDSGQYLYPHLLECVVVAVLVLPDLEPRVVPAPADDGEAVGGVEVVGVAELQPLQQRQRALDREEGGGADSQPRLGEVGHRDPRELQERQRLREQRELDDLGVQQTTLNGEMRQFWTMKTNTGY